MKRELEALLFATDAPLTTARLRKIFPEAGARELKEAVTALQQEYEQAGLAFTVVEFGGGWQVATRPEYAPLVERLLRTRKVARLSKAGLEVLAIVAYRQPITRLEIDEIRGVNSSGALATLSERHLITVVGRSQTVGNPLLYGTTREFLNHLGLKGLGQLPALPDLEDVVDDPGRLKEFASAVGREVTDEDLAGYFVEGEEDDADTDAGDAAAPDGPETDDPSPPTDDETAGRPAAEAAAGSAAEDAEEDDRS